MVVEILVGSISLRVFRQYLKKGFNTLATFSRACQDLKEVDSALTKNVSKGEGN